MSFWTAVQLQPNRERLALHFLELSGYAVYLPRIQERKVTRGRRENILRPLFPTYAFLLVERGWYTAAKSPGVVRLVPSSYAPARVPETLIAGIRARERNGVIHLPKAPCLRPGDPVRVLSGPFAGHLALYEGQAAHERVTVLLQLLGGQARVTLPATDVEASGMGSSAGGR